MKWSQLKTRVEATFADSVKGRVEIFETRYREAHDEAGEAWITLDKERLFSLGSWSFNKEYYTLLRSGEVDSRDATELIHQDGIFPCGT